MKIDFADSCAIGFRNKRDLGLNPVLPLVWVGHLVYLSLNHLTNTCISCMSDTAKFQLHL